MARTSRTPKIRLGELLVAAGLVTEDRVRHGLEEQRRNNLFLGEALVNLGYVSEEAIAQAIIQHFNLPFLSASQFNIPPEVFNLFPERMYNEYQFIAVDKIDRVIIIIAAGPINQDMMEELQRVSECKICHYVSTWRDIYASIQKNSKELGGEAQVELTGLGSMLLDTPKFDKSSPSITQKITKLGASSPTNAKPMQRSMTVIPKTVAAANLSAIMSPMAVASKAVGMSQVAAHTPPSPRLTAFLKVPPPSASQATLPAVGKSMSTAGLPAVRGLPTMSGASSANWQAVSGGASGAGWPAAKGLSSAGLPAVSPNAAPTNSPTMPPGASSYNLQSVPLAPTLPNIPAVKKDKDAPDSGDDKPKRMSSFLSIRKQ